MAGRPASAKTTATPAGVAGNGGRELRGERPGARVHDQHHPVRARPGGQGRRDLPGAPLDQPRRVGRAAVGEAGQFRHDHAGPAGGQLIRDRLPAGRAEHGCGHQDMEIGHRPSLALARAAVSRDSRLA